MKEVIFRYIDLPCAVKGYVREDPNGDYNVYINARYSLEVQRLVARHEMEHIFNQDFDNGLSIDKVEGF